MTDLYEPDGSAMRALFEPPSPLPDLPPVVAGHAFNGIDPAEADELRWSSMRKEPTL